MKKGERKRPIARQRKWKSNWTGDITRRKRYPPIKKEEPPLDWARVTNDDRQYREDNRLKNKQRSKENKRERRGIDSQVIILKRGGKGGRAPIIIGD